MASTLVDDDNETGTLSFEIEGFDPADIPALPDFPKGKYQMEVISAEGALSKASGRPMWVFKLRLDPDNFPRSYPVELAPEGMDFTIYRANMTNDLAGKHNMLRACSEIGVEMKKGLKLEHFVGCKVLAEVVPELGRDGRPRPVVRAVAPFKKKA